LGDANMSELKSNEKKKKFYWFGSPENHEEIRKGWKNLKVAGKNLGAAVDNVTKSTDGVFVSLFKLIIFLVILILIGGVFFV
jgi:hypothetical protein